MMYACNTNVPYTGRSRGNVGDLGFAAVQGPDLCDGGDTRRGAPAGREGPLWEDRGCPCQGRLPVLWRRTLRAS